MSKGTSRPRPTLRVSARTEARMPSRTHAYDHELCELSRGLARPLFLPRVVGWVEVGDRERAHRGDRDRRRRIAGCRPMVHPGGHGDMITRLERARRGLVDLVAPAVAEPAALDDAHHLIGRVVERRDDE